MYTHCYPQSSLEPIFSNKNKNKIELVVYYVLDVVFAAHRDTVLCVGKLALVVNLVLAS